MRINEKLELFSKLSIKDAEKKRDEIRAALEEKFQLARQRIAAEAEERRVQIVDAERLHLSQARNREALNAQTEIRRSLIDLRSQLMDELFQNVRDKIDAYLETPEYIDELMSGITRAVGEYPGGITVAVRPEDAAKITNPPPGAEIAAGDEGIIGGFTARVKGRHIFIDNSYRSKIEEARESFQGFRITE
jgi:vacuolar-type H+-ATPase subunit E/Vma4